ncbi:hypothetical protein ACYEXS_13210 [Paenibacillus sp. MAH-36]|uniref:Uncharacterized protein n=1 Tax=Paenibacillus violae TaxID=3077234 RepID=A0ABU3RP62_9BACL|nr:hypothetical protein [Paenibacillus sp. PFR10]MDU0205949.1 hypothetical protein [Paenibacillus sp. PFR10]
MRRLTQGIYVKICGLFLIISVCSRSLPAAAHEHGDSVTEIQMGPSTLTVNTSIASLIFVLLVVVVLILHLRTKKTVLTKMTGMMGAMLGVMVISDYPTLSIVFMDVVLAVSMLLLYKLLDAEENLHVGTSVSQLEV